MFRILQVAALCGGAGAGWLIGAVLGDDGERAERAAALLALGALAIAGASWLAKRGLFRWSARSSRLVFLLLGGLGFASSQNGFRGHVPSFVHPTDYFHYYLGARYFEELGYTRLYDCTVAALSADGVPTPGWKMRHLEDDAVVPVDPAGARVQECPTAFTEARWNEFAADIRSLRSRVGESNIRASLNDHGFNASPAWTLAPRAAIALTGDTAEGATRLVWVDTALVALGGLLILRAFGSRTFAVVMIFLACHAPNRWDWVGGSLFRMDWWFLLAAGLSAARLCRQALASAALTAAALLRVFPIIALLGFFLSAWVRRRRQHRDSEASAPPLARGALGAAATVALLGAGTLMLGPMGQWPAFAENTVKHVSRPGYNSMGLKMVLTHTKGNRLVDLPDGLPQRDVVWGERRNAAFASLWPLRWIIVLGCAAALWRALSRTNSVATGSALSLALLPILTTFTSYYSSALAFVFVGARRHRLFDVAFLGAAAASQVLNLTARLGQHAPLIDTFFAIASAIDLGLMFLVLAHAAGFANLPKVGRRE
jgi:hypothetical protein